MAIVPSDLRYPDLSASDVLAQSIWPRRAAAPLAGLDVICIKIAVDFQSMTQASAPARINANLELLREATRSDAAFHMRLDPDTEAFADISVARSMFATGTPEQLRGETLAAMPWFRARLAPLRVAEIRDTSDVRADQAQDAALWRELGIGSVLTIIYYIEGRPAGILGIAGGQPRDTWDV